MQDRAAFAQSLEMTDEDLERKQQEYLIYLSNQISQIKEAFRGELRQYALQYQRAGKNDAPE